MRVRGEETLPAILAGAPCRHFFDMAAFPRSLKVSRKIYFGLFMLHASAEVQVEFREINGSNVSCLALH